MPIQSLNWNDKIRNLAGGDNLSDLQKKSLMDQYNSNIPSLPNQLGYLANYGPTTNPSRSAVQVINSAYDTSGNGGRKLVRLSNGWIIALARDGVSFTNIYVSKDNGATFTRLCYLNADLNQGFAVTSIGTNIYVIGAVVGVIYHTKIDALTVSNVQISVTNLETQTSANGVFLTYSPTDNKLKAAWASKNATLPNSFNIRYAEGTINGDGSVTWGAVTQVTTANTSGSDYKNPTIVVKLNGNPSVLMDYYNGSVYTIYCTNFSGGSPSGTVIVHQVSTYAQSSPSATVDGNGVIHVVWQGADGVDTSPNIRYSKSTDGGVTFSAMTKLTTGLNTQSSPSITFDTNNNLYVYWMGVTATSGGRYNIRSITYTTSWGSIVEVTNQSTNSMMYPSLCDNLRTFTSPLVIWQDNVSPSVKFSGAWTDTPLLSESTSISRVSNKALIDAIVSLNKIGSGSGKKASGTGTSSSGTVPFTNVSGGTNNASTLTVSGLSFKPSVVEIYASDGTFRSAVDTNMPLNAGYNLIGCNNQQLRLTGNAVITSTSFTLPTSTVTPSENVIWKAFE